MKSLDIYLMFQKHILETVKFNKMVNLTHLWRSHVMWLHLVTAFMLVEAQNGREYNIGRDREFTHII